MSPSTAPVQETTATTTWKTDPVHSSAQFKVKPMMISNVKGEFGPITGSLQFDNSNLANSKVEASIDAATITTGDAQRDAHLKSPDFFDVDKFPALAFKSTHVSKKGEEELAVAGDLTIHGVTRPVVFDVEGPSAPAKDPWGNTRIGLSASTRINRKDFGLTWNAALETGGILVGEEVVINLEVQFIRA
jgi:polyisoprenoid-binding protein YceI